MNNNTGAASWTGGTLQERALGPTSVLFQAIATAGPAAGVATSLVFVASYAGGSSPLAVLLGTAGILLIAYSISQLAQKVPSAGGLYSYTAAGLGRNAGFLVSWAILLAEFINVPVVFLGFLYVTQSDLTAHLGAPGWIWVPLAFVGLAVVTMLTYRGIKLSARVVMLLGAAELLILVSLAITLIVVAGHHNTFSVFANDTGNAHGFGSDFAAIIYCVLAFVGFDAAAPLAEEARDPRRSVPRALVGSVLATGIFFTLCMYAGVVYWGPHRIGSFVTFNGGDPFDGMAAKVWGAAWVVVLLAILNSLYVGTIGATNAASRYQFAMGRIRILPFQFASLHRTHRTPWCAILAQAFVTLALSLILGYTLGSPAAAFGFLATVVVLLFLLIYGLTSLSCLALHLRDHRHEFRIIAHGIVPVLGAAFMVPVLVGSLGINFAGLGIAPLTGASRWAPEIAGGWMLIGIVVLIAVQDRWRDKLAQLDRVFLHPDGREPACADVASDGKRPMASDVE
jgi:amino acid transporter